ncbi:MAG: response regulator, partial [Bacilli bacterium]|nr:response regulator [Bacilli bacterium]
ANMSNEIRTPMNTIIGFAESLLSEKDLTEEIVKRDMAYIHDSSITLLELINNILDISRIESGREKIAIKDYQLQDMVFEVNSLVTAKMKNKEVTFNINIDHNLPRTLKGDSQKIVKVIVNILTCAVNYTSYGKIDLNINKHQREDGKFEFEILVANTGHALQEQDFDLSFNDFIKVGTERDNTIDGVKLGLMCAKEYADMMGGHIEFKNEVGKGTRYFFYLEQEIADNSPCGDIFAHASDKIEHKLFDLTGKRVLVVDDSKVNVKLAQRLLAPYNLVIDTALSGNECLELVKNNKYDMIFLDHMMPEMDGVTTLKFLKSNQTDLPPVIALTANSYNGAKEKYAELGFSSYLAKPISYKELNKIMYEFFYNEDNKLIESNTDNNNSTQTVTEVVKDEEGVEIL